MMQIKQKKARSIRRQKRVRARIFGTAVVPRLTVKRSAKHIYAQLIDDAAGQTLACASDVDVKEKGKPMQVAAAVGEILAQKANALGISKAVFDRGAYRYHGCIAAISQAAREKGLKN